MGGLRPALSTFIFLLLITGGVYPLLTTVLGQWWFPWQANGSLIREGDTVRGSALIGQNFTGNGYFMVARRQRQKCPIIHRLLAGAIWRSVILSWIN